jgi:hypothetical protein
VSLYGRHYGAALLLCTEGHALQLPIANRRFFGPCMLCMFNISEMCGGGQLYSRGLEDLIWPSLACQLLQVT